ncbi:MAG: tRNA pseudouridine(38-40) synthase TruA [Cyclobacteriaceae bacterium]
MKFVFPLNETELIRLFCGVRYFLDISYKGTNFHGWQIQPNGNTVQAEIEQAVSTILKTKTSVIGSGRTDTGVHATQQIAHIDVDNEIQHENLVYKLNSFLPKDISVNEIVAVRNEAHARFDAKKRTYHYHIHQRKNPFKQESSYYFNPEINISQIKKACEIIREWKNFECFSKVHTEVNNFDCEIYDVKWTLIETNHLFVVQANRFLRGMIRAMVGTLLDIGCEKSSLDDLQKILRSGDRSMAGRAVPAHGLFLEKVEYEQKIYK